MTEIELTILQMALVGYEAERQKIEARVAEIRNQLGGGAQRFGVAAVIEMPPKRKLSAEGRQRIAEAQKKRWAAFRQNQA